MATKEQQREYQRRWRADRRDRAIALLGGQCARCGTIEDLEFDHIDPATKDPELRKWGVGFPLTWSWVRIEAELAKCQLLCQECHSRKTFDDAHPDGIRHGTPGAWRSAKCRCDICRAWQAKDKREYRARKRGEG